MKTPDKIKKGLGWCSRDTTICTETCPYYGSLSNGVECASKLQADALAYIQQLERERDALLNIIKHEATFISHIPLPCRCCKNIDGAFTSDVCRNCATQGGFGGFEWCGVKEDA